MTYYDELRGKILGYESRFNEKPTNVIIGYQLVDWFIDFVYKKENFYNAEIVNVFGTNCLLKIEGLEVDIDYNVPYTISVYKKEKNEDEDVYEKLKRKYKVTDYDTVNKSSIEEVVEAVKVSKEKSNSPFLEELARKEQLRREKAEHRRNDDEMNELLSKLLFNRQERTEIMNITQKKANEIDRDLKDLKLWIEFGEYLKERGENEDEL